jgi:hypothetical protein
MPFVLNDHPTQFFSIAQYASDVIVAPCCLNSIITPFLSQKALAASLLTDVCLNFLNSAAAALTAPWFQHSLMKPRFLHVTCVMWLRNSLPSLWFCSKKSQNKIYSLHFTALMCIF